VGSRGGGGSPGGAPPPPPPPVFCDIPRVRPRAMNSLRRRAAPTTFCCYVPPVKRPTHLSWCAMCMYIMCVKGSICTARTTPAAEPRAIPSRPFHFSDPASHPTPHRIPRSGRACSGGLFPFLLSPPRSISSPKQREADGEGAVLREGGAEEGEVDQGGGRGPGEVHQGARGRIVEVTAQECRYGSKWLRPACLLY
jgi:hypothetical protein